MNDRGGGRRSSDAGEAKGGEPTDETAALRVGIGDGANARKEDMVKLAGSKKVAGTAFRVNPNASSTSMARKHKRLITRLSLRVPPVPRLAYKSWKAIEEALADYEKATNTHYRVRSSGSVREYNETYSDQLPMGLELSFKTYSRGWSTASLLADAKASTKDIGVFLSRQLGRKFTPQQTKNLLKRIGNNKLSQDRLKMFLYALAQVEGNEVMLMQDQFDVTCGIVIQTPAQNLCFEHWGQTLAMDWTHSTNNLGFHLGSLVATGSSGCGIPVFDFMAVNEKAKTLKVIFE
ncbi:hypothetical protein PC116_g21039 [Phytophthora cactorum]|nr:hypothetical protein PC112_g11995 [Phytophthora cactorum]KAG4230681.1 hypothetical protein PC116_g21039 [Phytophthora cactorum]